MMTRLVSEGRGCRKGFTLVELLVVIAIIGILIALLLPAVQAAREAARRAQCSNNLKQISLALHNYHDANKTFPFAWMVDLTNGVAALGNVNAQVWGTRILPYLEQQALYDQFDSRYPALTNVPIPQIQQNSTVIQTPVAAFTCPSTPGDAQSRIYDSDLSSGGFPLTYRAAPSDYTAITGVRGGFSTIAYAGWTGSGGREGVLQYNGSNLSNPTQKDSTSSRIGDITDGTSNTAMVGERVGGDEIYVKGGRMPSLTEMPLRDIYKVTNGGGWGDILNGEHWYEGSLHDGLQGGGPCAINCNNVRSQGFFSFHPGGAQFALADGSVRFVSETVAAFVFASLTTRKRGEVFTLE